MIFDPSTSSHLKPWLIRTLEPICDAEPGALADYILALLKHNVPENEMRKELAVQLEEFLEKECSTFIDTLFTVLRTKSYLPYAAPSPPTLAADDHSADSGIPIPLEGLLPSSPGSTDRRSKRTLDGEGGDGQAPAKGPRLSADGQFSRYSSHHGGRGHRPTGAWVGQVEGQVENDYNLEMYGADGMVPAGLRMNLNGSRNLNGRRQQGYQPPDMKRGVCRDYHNHGYCARGAMCKYSHGEEAVIPGMYPSIPMPFIPMFAGMQPFGFGHLGAAYDPHEARMDMRPMNRPLRAPLLPRVQQTDGTQVIQSSHISGELPVIQDLTPVSARTDAPLPQEVVPQIPTSPSQIPDSLAHSSYQMLANSPETADEMVDNSAPQSTPQSDMACTPTSNNATTFSKNRTPRGTFGGEVHSFRPERRSDTKTLVVEKIPHDRLSLEQVNEWFKRFGTVTNVAVDSSSAKALVSFSSHEEAYAAHRSQEAIFGNRFVKVYWHRPMDGHGQIGAKMLAASAPLVANITNKSQDSTSSMPVGTSKITQTPKKPAATSSIAAKQQLLERQIAEQKSLMAALVTASAEEKKTILARLRKLGEEMKSTPSEVVPESQPRGASAIETERERLDKELDMHTASAAQVGEEETTEVLKVKLEKLKAEAAMLGIPESGTGVVSSGGFRPYRGRGRGVRGHRGSMRGVHLPRSSMKLDNRPKNILVKGVPEDGLGALRDWFETTGQVESMTRTDAGEVIVLFKTRSGAEQGLLKGNNVPTVGALQMTWYNPKTAESVERHIGMPNSDLSTLKVDDGVRLRSPEHTPHSPHGHDEEVAVSGWGGDGDAEDGMGML